MPRVSIIIPNLNGLRFLNTCFGTLWCQTFRNFEVIMVDDASSDDSIMWTRTHFPEVHIVELAQSSGLAIACNRGAAVAQGDILVMLNNDTEMEPDWLEALVQAIDKNPRTGAVASKMRLFDRRDMLHTTGDMIGKDGIPRNRGVWEKDDGQYDNKTKIFGACGGGVAYRHTAWEEAGGFDENLFMYMEDVDLAWRLQLMGWEAIFAPDACLYHHVSATGGGSLASFYTGRNTLWVIAKNMPSPFLRKYWRKIVSAQFKITVNALRSWRGAAARARLKGQFVGLLGLPMWLYKRKQVQANIRVSLSHLEDLLVDC